jgi:hypothetical protein
MGLRPPLQFATADAARKVTASSAHRVQAFPDPGRLLLGLEFANSKVRNGAVGALRKLAPRVPPRTDRLRAGSVSSADGLD